MSRDGEGRPGRRRRFTVLIVDDEPMGFVRLLLVRAGYDVLRARSVREALEALAAISDPIDLLLVDMEVSGAAEKVLAQQAAARTHPTRVLYLSALSSEERSRRGLGDANVIDRPSEAEALLQRIRAALGDEDH